MSPAYISYLLLLATTSLLSCTPGTEKKFEKGRVDIVSEKQVPYLEGFPSLKERLNRKITTPVGNYYSLRTSSDSTVSIFWGNGNFEREYSAPLGYFFAEKLRVQWESKDYLILRYGLGSDAWQSIVLPLNRQEQVQVLDNTVYIDTSAYLLISTYCQDTILVINNLKTRQKQFVIDEQRQCTSVNSSYCIENIRVIGRVLYYDWIIPNKFDDGRKKGSKKIKLII